MVLVSLLGDFDSFVTAVFFEYKNQITLHILARDESDRGKKNSARIMRGLAKLREKYRLKCTLREMWVDPDNMRSVVALAESIKQFAPPEHLFINLSDGAANAAIILSRELLDGGANIIIADRFENSLTLLTLNGMEKRSIKNNMGIEDYIISKGYDLVESKSADALESRKDYVNEITKNFALFQKYRKRIMESKEIDEELYGAIVRPLAQIGAVNRRGKPINLNYILGELFEEQIYHIARQLPFDDILSGVKVRYETINNITIENEFDLLMIKNNRLYIIECKFRDRVDGENLIYKYDALLEQMDEDGKAMIVNVASTETKEALKRGKRIHKNFERGSLYRAQLNNILIYYEPALDPNKLIAMMRAFFLK